MGDVAGGGRWPAWPFQTLSEFLKFSFAFLQAVGHNAVILLFPREQMRVDRGSAAYHAGSAGLVCTPDRCLQFRRPAPKDKETEAYV